jgi:hypothetical protein
MITEVTTQNGTSEAASTEGGQVLSNIQILSHRTKISNVRLVRGRSTKH